MLLKLKQTQSTKPKFGSISEDDLRALGAENIAYIREVKDSDGNPSHFDIYAATGQFISREDNAQRAIENLRAHNVLCATVH